MAQTLREFMRVVKPIAQRGIVAFAMTEPAVVQNKQLDARIFCTAGEGEQLFFAEIKVGCFPVVDQNGAAGRSEFAGRNPAVNERVELTAHAVKSVGRIAQVSFRCLECASGVERPAEIERIDTDLCACYAEGIDGHIGGEAAGVAEGESIHIARGFGCVRGKQSHERAGLMTRGAALTGYALMPGDERADEFAAFPRPCTAQRQQGEISLLKIDACAQGFLKDDGRSAVVYDFCASRDDVDVVIDGVRQLDGNAAVCVAEREQKRLALFTACGRQTGKRRLFGQNAMGNDLQIQRVRTIRMLYVEHAGAQVARAERRAFLRKNIERQLMQGKGLIGITGQSGKHVVPNRTDALAPIDVEQVFARCQTDNVADMVVKQMKDVCFLTEQNRHERNLLESKCHGEFDAFSFIIGDGEQNGKTAKEAKRFFAANQAY